jgi:hypothetical protein
MLSRADIILLKMDLSMGQRAPAGFPACMLRMAAGVSQAWSWATRGCVRGSNFVRFRYVSKALLIIS